MFDPLLHLALAGLAGHPGALRLLHLHSCYCLGLLVVNDHHHYSGHHHYHDYHHIYGHKVIVLITGVK